MKQYLQCYIELGLEIKHVAHFTSETGKISSHLRAATKLDKA